MSETFECGDNAALVGYLYDECEAGERAVIEAHVAVCAACTAELAALGSTRVQLAAWTPPEAKLGFVITHREPAQPARFTPSIDKPRVGWFARPLPGWAQLAAACVVFGVGLSLGIVRGTSGTVTPAGVAASTAPVSSSGVTAADLTALENRLRNEIAATRTVSRQTNVAAPLSGLGASETQLMARVRALIEESEQRQQRQLALRTAEIVNDFDSQRRVDLAQIQRNFGQIEGLTGAEVREQREMLNYLMRVSQQR
jgi:anti-sigma factor RsiW